MPGRTGLGGICVSVGSTTAATRSSIATYFGYASASRALNFAISRAFCASSAPSMRYRPSGNGENDDGLRSSSSKP